MMDLKRLKNHYANYEPMLKLMRGKYETAMKVCSPTPHPPLVHAPSRSTLSSRPSGEDAHQAGA